MARTVGDLTKPLNRTISTQEAEKLRQLILRNLRTAWGTAFRGCLALAAIFGGASVVDYWFNGPRWPAVIAIQVGLAGIFVLIGLNQARRLLALGTLTTLPVHRAVVAIDGGFGQLHSVAAFKKEHLYRWNYGLHSLNGQGSLNPEYVWELELVRTLRGGPEQYFVLDARPLRAATDEERRLLNKFLWKVGVYQHPD